MSQSTYFKLDDRLVTDMRKAARANPEHGAMFQAKTTGLSIHTIRKALSGVTFKHLNDNEPPVIRVLEKLTDEQVLIVRRIAAEGPVDYEHHAKAFGVAINTLENAVRGRTYRHLNDQVAPTVTSSKSDADRFLVRKLYQEKLSLSEIAKQAGVAKSTVVLWCSDLTGERASPHKKKRGRPKAAVLPKEPGRKSNGSQVLTDEQVLKLRRDVRREKVRALHKRSIEYNASATSIAQALRGVSFKHLNAIEPPVLERLRPDMPFSARLIPDESLMAEMISMRRGDPQTWSYAALAKWISEKTELLYKASHVSRVLIKRDPSLKDLEPIDAIAKREKRAAERLALKQRLEEEDRLEAWHAAGRPDDWIWT
jgi:transposase